MTFEPMNFINNLYYMGVGMLNIFIVIFAIMIVTVLLNLITKRKKKKGGNKQ